MCGETAAALLSCVLCLNARALRLIHRTFMCILHIFSCTTVSRCARAGSATSRSSPSTDPTPAPCTPNLRQAQYRAIRTWPAHVKLSGCTCQVPEPTHLQPGVAPTIHVKLAAAPQHPTALVASRTIIASPIGVRAARALLLIALDRLNAEGDAPVREVHACVGTVSEIGLACV